MAVIPEALLVGQSIGHYRILNKLGAGGMGVVYLAEDLRLKRKVALKILPQEVSSFKGRLERFQREAEILAALEHPSIVTIHSIEDADGVRFLTMQYVEGRTLSKVIPKHGLPLDRFFRMATELADAVGAAHEKGVVHRDLKPGNVMVTREDRVKILDFGLGKLVREVESDWEPSATTETLTGANRRLGTLPYMSPEQIRGGPVDHRADIFALGVLLYEMASGKYPFDRDSSADLASSILRDQPDSVDELRPSLPHHLGRLIRQCLEKNPDRRLQSAKDLRNALEDLKLELSRPEPSDASGEKVVRRYRTWAVGLSLALVAAVTLIAGLFLAGRESGPGPPSDRRPHYIGIEPVSSFADNQTPDHYRLGAAWIIQHRLRSLGGFFTLIDRDLHAPEFLLQVDTRRNAGEVNLSYRLENRQAREFLGGEVLRGAESDLFALTDRLIRSVADLLSRDLEIPLRHAAPPILSRNAEAIDRFLAGIYRLEASNAGDGADGAGHLEAALQAFEESAQLDPDFALAVAYRGLTLQRRHLTSDSSLAVLSQSQDLCGEATRMEPLLDLAWFCHGEAYRMAERYLDAVAEYARAVESGLRDPMVLDAARSAFTHLGRPESEERFWKEIVEQEPLFFGGYQYLGLFYLDRARYQEAFDQYHRAIELAPRNSDLYNGLFNIQFELGRFGEAIDTLERALELNPGDHRAWGNLGHVYFLLRRFDDAIVAFETSLGFESADHRGHGYLGRAYFWAPEQRDEAVPHLQRAIEICKQEMHSEPANARHRILLAWYQAMLGQRESSLDSLSAALNRRPGSGHFLYLAGLIHNLLGKEEEAIANFEQAVAGGWGTVELRTSIEVDNLRDDARFEALLKSE